MLTSDEVAELSDRLFQLRCAAEDVATAVSERAEPHELDTVMTTLLTAARAAERLR